MARHGLRRNKKGQFLVLTSLGVVIVMVALSSVLAYTAVSPIHFSKTGFREMATELDLNFRGAVAISLAEVSNELEQKASTLRYVNFTRLEDYPDAEKEGWEFMKKWHNATLMKYTGLGINLNISMPVFRCDWGSYQGISSVKANMTLDILSYGFYGWKSNLTVDLNLTIVGLKETDGNSTMLYFTVKKESDIPISVLTSSMIKVLFQRRGGTFRTATVTEITYFGEGTYLVKCYTNMPPILEALDILETYIIDLGNASFIPPNSPEALCNKVDAVINQYNIENFMGVYDKLTHDVRPHLDPSTNQAWVYEDVDTSLCLALIDDVLSQLFPYIKVILTDPRGIIVGVYSQLTYLGNDTLGPRAENIVVTPNPVIGSDEATLTAKIRDSRSNILCAEYFVGAIGPDGTGTPMTPVDGAFDSPEEKVRAKINVTGWENGEYVIYVHGKDTADNWGSLSSIVLRVTGNPSMHIASIDMSIETRGGWNPRVRAVAVVTMVDSLGDPVEGATVYGYWSGTTDRPLNPFGLTNTEGRVTFKSEWVRGGGTFTFTVSNVTLSVWIYDEEANVETSDTISG